MEDNKTLKMKAYGKMDRPVIRYLCDHYKLSMAQVSRALVVLGLVSLYACRAALAAGVRGLPFSLLGAAFAWLLYCCMRGQTVL